MTSKIIEKYATKLDDYIEYLKNPSSSNVEIKTVEDYERNINMLIKLTIQNSGVEKDKIEHTKEKIYKNSSFITVKSRLSSAYSQTLNQNEKFKDLYTNTAKADRGEKLRALSLRVGTAIFIAAIVLATSYIAKELEIPLPLRMGLTG